jgi:hypothetical protein
MTPVSQPTRRTALLLFASAACTWSCGDDPPCPEALSGPVDARFEALDLVGLKYPSSRLEQVADLARLGGVAGKYGLTLGARLRLTNPHDRAVAVAESPLILEIIPDDGGTPARLEATWSATTLAANESRAFTVEFSMTLDTSVRRSIGVLENARQVYRLTGSLPTRPALEKGCAPPEPVATPVAGEMTTIANHEAFRRGAETAFQVVLAIAGALLKAAR